MRNLKILIVAGGLIFWGYACDKNETDSLVNDNLFTQEVTADNFVTELDAMTDEAVELQLVLKSAEISWNYLTESCPIKTYDRTSNPKVLTLDFGTGCKGVDGKVRTGKIIIKSDSFEDQTATREKTFENFTVNGNKVSGKITKTNVVNRDDHTRTAKITEDVTITFTDGKVASRKGTLTREYQLGVLLVRNDDKMVSWGEMVITRKGGITITKMVAESTPLVFAASCRQIISGKVNFSTGAGQAWSVDFGNGECDGVATVTRGSDVKTITLR